jgi:hypothetical protein
MDFNQTSKITPATKINPTPIATGSQQKFKAGSSMVASAEMIPQPVRARLTALSSAYGLPVDLGSLALADANPENIKALRSLADMARANSKLLPELLKLTKQLMSADIKQAEFMAKLNNAAIAHGEKLDTATAQIFSRFAASQAKSSKLEHRVNVRNELLDKRSAAYQSYYSQSVYGSESHLIDLEYQLKATDNQILADSRQHRLKANSERKAKLQQYLDSAY